MLSLSRGFTFFFGLRRAAAFGIFRTPNLPLERGLVIEGGARSAAATRRGRAGPRVVGVAATAATAATALATVTTGGAATARAARHLLHLRRGIAQRRADLVDFQLDDRALLALAGLIRPLAQPAADDHPGATLQRLGDVLRRLAPHV